MNKKFVEHINSSHRPNEKIMNALDEGKFPFSKNSFFSYDPSLLASDEFNRCALNYDEITPGSTMSDLNHITALMIFHEDGHRKQLEKLCEKVVRDMYDIPEKISIQTEIKWTSDMEGFNKKESHKEDKIEETREIRFEIEKRRILNSIIQGGAIHQWNSSFYLIEEELNTINAELLPLYRQYSAIINYYNWKHSLATADKLPVPPSNVTKTSMDMFVIQGTSKVDYQKKQLQAVGLSVPVAIHEVSKATLEYIMSKGLPNHLKENEIRYVLDKADKLTHEFWHYYMGPTLWRAILTTANVHTQELPKILSAMAQMSYEDLSMFCVKITFDQEETGAIAMKELKRSLKIK